MRSTPVNGSLPMRFFLAGTLCTTTLSRPGSVNSPRPFLSTEASIADSSEASTDLTDFRSMPECSATWVARLDLLNAVLIGFSAAGAAAGALTALAAAFTGALVDFAGAALTAFLTTGAEVFFAVAMSSLYLKCRSVQRMPQRRDCRGPARVFARFA